MKRIEIRPLSPELIPDYLSFFDSITFEEHPHWADCYCYSFHFTGPSEEWQREKNRSCAVSLIREGRMKGYLAYHEGVPVGWCNVNNRLSYQRLTKLYDLPDPGHPRICSMVCFLVHPGYRRQGMMQQMLDRIIIDYRALHYDYIEAYPGRGRLSAENLYRGPLDFLLRNGFVPIREFEDYQVVRREIS